MARRLGQLIRLIRPLLPPLTVALLLLISADRPAWAEPAPSPSPATPGPAIPPFPPAAHTPTPPVQPTPTPVAKPKPPKPDEWGEARKLFEQLSPDQQKKFLDNLNQWKAMSPEEQEHFRDQELLHREKIAQEIQDAINKSGLRLDDDQREVYALRYTQERRKIEIVLRKEMDQQRQSMVGEMLSRLKVEFTTNPPPSAKATPIP